MRISRLRFRARWEPASAKPQATIHGGPRMTLGLIDTATLADELRSRIEQRTARLCVVGLGYVGLPLAETFAWGGYPVLGFDIDQGKVESLKRGESYIGHIGRERVAELVKS